MITEGDPRPQVDGDVSVEELDGGVQQCSKCRDTRGLTTQSILPQLATVALPLPATESGSARSTA
jgi:hypothetical protein